MSHSILNHKLKDYCKTKFYNSIVNFKNNDNQSIFIKDTNDIDEYLMILIYLSETDINTSIKLLIRIFSLQDSIGRIPSKIFNNDNILFTRAPKPMLSYASFKILLKSEDENLAKLIYPKVKLYILWLLKYFDPLNKSEYKWMHKEEYISDINNNSLTPDLYALLISEIKSFDNISIIFPNIKSDKNIFNKYYNNIKNDLDILFLKHEKNEYSSMISNNDENKQCFFYSYTPLINNFINSNIKFNMLNKLKNFYYNPKDNDLKSWINPESEFEKKSIFKKFLFLEILNIIDNNKNTSYDYLKLFINKYNNWYIENKNNISDKISTTSASQILLIDQYFINMYKTKYIRFNKLIFLAKKAKINRLDFAIISLIAITYFGIIYWNYQAKQPPPLPILEAEILNSYMLYDIDGFKRIYSIIEKNYSYEISKYKLLLVNLILLDNNFNNSLKIVNEMRKIMPDSPSLMIIQGFSLHNQDKFNDASKAYDEFCFLYNEIYPNIVKQIKVYKFLSDESLSLPSDWKKIFRYRMMHEI